MDGKQVECLSSIIAVLILGIVIIVHDSDIFYWQRRMASWWKNFLWEWTKDTVNAARTTEYSLKRFLLAFLYDAGEDD